MAALISSPISKGTPAPIAADHPGPKPAIPAIVPAYGASFLTAFFASLKIFLRKNSGCPVIGFIELNSLPTIYLCGSMPMPRICAKSIALSLGFSSKTAIGTIVSPSAACTIYASSYRPKSASLDTSF